MGRRVAVIVLILAGLGAAAAAVFLGAGPKGPSTAEAPAAAEAAGSKGGVEEVDRTVDWGAAAEKAGLTGKTVVSAQSVGVDVESPVPVLALPNLSAQSVNSGSQTVKATSDGYYASFPGAKYDVVLTGTKKAYKAPDTAPPPTVTTQSVDDFNFSQTETGADVTFKQFNADYLVQFECKKASAQGNCITEKEARDVVESLVMVGN